MKLISTRNLKNTVSPLESVLKGIAEDGGLFVPETYPKLSLDEILGLAEMDYAQAAAKILGLYFPIPKDELLEMTRKAYAGFDDERITPMKRLGHREIVVELFHGPTLAFKDMALQVLPRLMSKALSETKAKNKVLILTATSGDTGKAALEGFQDVPNTRIAVFYPSDGVSDMQKLQMITQKGDNTYVCGVNGNFDDAQTGVKKMFADLQFNDKVNEAGYRLSSANSINFGRLAPQIVYYMYAYAHLVRSGDVIAGEAMNIVVPTGNFGDILAAYYAKQMGLPVAKLICASNKNNILTDFFESGRYVTQRSFFKTMSPSMDILISSNLERFLFDASGRDTKRVRNWMRGLKDEGEYTVDGDVYRIMRHDFYADFADDVATRATISKIFREKHYLMDPHTGVAQTVYEHYVQATGDPTPTMLMATASPFKFSQDVCAALTRNRIEDPFIAAIELSRITKIPMPYQLESLRREKIRFRDTVVKTKMADAILRNIDTDKMK